MILITALGTAAIGRWPPVSSITVYPPSSSPTVQGTWKRIFYPPSGGGSKQFDEVRFYAEHLDAVEVDSTFYGQPRAEVTREWAERTPPDFEFSIKLYQKFTHPRVFEQRLERSLGGLAADPASLKGLPQPARVDRD